MATLVNMRVPIAGTANTTATEVVPEERARSYLIIQNRGSLNSLLVKFEGDFVGDDGLEIGPGGSYEPISIPLDSIWVKAKSGTTEYVIVRGS